jgi:hypothetical protein
MRSDPKAFPEFYPGLHDDAPFAPPRLAASWKPHKLIGDVWAENDYPGENAPAWLVPVFSPRAVEGLREFLEPNGEILPVRTPLGTYYAYNVTRVVDALDLSGSAHEHQHRIREVARYAFKVAEVSRLTVFKVPQMPVEIYVTEPFVARARVLGLNGMWLTKCWPLPEGVDWRVGWREVLERMKASVATVAEPPVHPKPARPPRVLDLRRDVEALSTGLVARAMRWVSVRQAKWAAHEELVSAIGLESSGWDLPDGPEVMCHVDTRDRHEADGDWSHFNVATQNRPRWTALIAALEESADARTVVDARGESHTFRGGDAKLCDRLMRLFGETMVAALADAKARGAFAGLLKPAKCGLSVEDVDSGFYWPGSRQKRDARAE